MKLGKDELQQARAEMILDHFTDLQGCFRECYLEPDEKLKKEKFQKFAEEQIPHYVGLLEKLLKQNKTEYLVGSELTSRNFSLSFKICKARLKKRI